MKQQENLKLSQNTVGNSRIIMDSKDVSGKVLLNQKDFHFNDVEYISFENSHQVTWFNTQMS